MAAANAVVDRHQHDRTGEDGDGRRDLRHMLGFEGAERAPFVNMLAHPRVAGYLNTIVGRGYRMGPPRPSPPGGWTPMLWGHNCISEITWSSLGSQNEQKW